MPNPIIAVIGSVNVDIVSNTRRFPKPGETIQSNSFEIGFGGKGANQAVACARMCRTQKGEIRHNVETYIIGALGDDQLCHGFAESLQSNGLNTSKLSQYRGEQTGVSVITVNAEGENTIVYSANANDTFPKDHSASLVPEDTAVAVFQLELRPEVVFKELDFLRGTGTQTILNPSPAVPVPDQVLSGLDFLVVNETETAILCNIPEESVTIDNLDTPVNTFLDKGVKNVVVTLGPNGAYWNSDVRRRKGLGGKAFPSRKTKPVDTTAAGDTFLGAFAVFVARYGSGEGMVGKAIQFGCLAGSRAVENKGAQSSIPWLDELPDCDKFLTEV